jgi:hypothetical protein
MSRPCATHTTVTISTVTEHVDYVDRPVGPKLPAVVEMAELQLSGDGGAKDAEVDWNLPAWLRNS